MSDSYGVASMLVFRAFGLPFGMRARQFLLLGWALVGSLVPTPGGAAGAISCGDSCRTIAWVCHASGRSSAIVLHMIDFSRR